MDTFLDFFDLLTWVIVIVIFLSIILPQMVKIMREYERAVVFRLGKFYMTKGPGLIILIPFIDKIDARRTVLKPEIPGRSDVHSQPKCSFLKHTEKQLCLLEVAEFN